MGRELPQFSLAASLFKVISKILGSEGVSKKTLRLRFKEVASRILEFSIGGYGTPLVATFLATDPMTVADR